MKIVHVSHLYHPSSGGVQAFFKEVSERLVRDYGDDVTVVTTNSEYGPERQAFKEIKPATEVINGVKVLRFPFERGHLARYRLLFKILAKLGITPSSQMVLKANGPYSPQMKQYLVNAEADAICGSASNYWFMQLPLWRRCNFFYYGSIHLHHDSSKQRLLKAQRASMNASSLYLANTQYEKRCLQQLGVQSQKIFVLGTGVDTTSFEAVKQQQVTVLRQQLGLPEDALVFGYVGRIEKTKNVALLVAAFAEMATRHPNAYLLLAGSAAYYAEALREHCRQLGAGISSKIKWCLNFPLRQKAVIFNTIDVLVLPSHNESFGIVFLEAWSCKKPVIGAATGAISDVISEGEDGLLMEVNNVKSLEYKMSLLAQSTSLRRELGMAGFRKVKAQYTWDIIVERLRQCYLAGGKPEPTTKARSLDHV